MRIFDGMVLKDVSEDSPLKGLHRVIQVFPDDDEVVLIEIPSAERVGETGTKLYYAKGFFVVPLSELSGWADRMLINEAVLVYPPLWNLSDKEIRELYPSRKNREDSFPLCARDRKWGLIEPMLPQHEFTEAAQYRQLQRMSETRAKEAKVSKVQILDALHRYFAFGCIRNALLPNTAVCGAPNRCRVAKNGIKLGRKNASARVGKLELAGKILAEEDICKLQDGWALYVKPGTSVSEAFFAMSSAFYRSKFYQKNGAWVAELLPANERPTEREFRYHGPNGQAEGAAARRLMGEGEWLKNCRELIGTAKSWVHAFGQVGSIDASPIDVNLVTCFNPMLPIGVGRGVFVRDVKCELILGWHIAIGGIGTDDANMAILKAALDKTPLLERYGLQDLDPDDFPCAFFFRILSDNGELRAIKGIDSVVEKLGGKIDFIATGRPDLNSLSESGHHVRHRRFDHHLEGTNKGRQKKRGEVLAITKALLSLYRYERLLIQWIHWYNTKQEVRHLLTVEMRRDNVKPTRIEIYRWLKKKGYVAGLRRDATHLKSHLLPTFKASITRKGLVLHRPTTNSAVELLHGALFSHPYLAASGLIRAALNGGKKHIEVRADPDDLSCVYLFDPEGMHVIPNVSDDLLLVQEGCIADLGGMNDSDRQDKVESASERDQAEAEMRSIRVEAVAEAKRSTKTAMAQGPTTSVKRDRSSVRENQRQEKRAQLDAAVSRAYQSVDTTTASPAASVGIVQDQEGAVSRIADQTMGDLMRQRLKGFHQRRNT